MKKIFIVSLMTLCCAVSLMAQSSDKHHLGFFQVPNYPIVKMQSNNETYAIVTDRIVPLTSDNSYIGQYMNLSCNYLSRVSSPDGADFIISVSNVATSTTTPEVYHVSKKRPTLPSKITSTGKVEKNTFSSFKYTSDLNPLKSSSLHSEYSFVAIQTRTIQFNVEVINQQNGGETVFQDTVYACIGIECNPQENGEEAKKTVTKDLERFTLKTVMTQYGKFLSSILGGAPTTVNFRAFSVNVKKKCTIDYSDINNAYTNFEQAYEFLKKRQSKIDKFKEMAEPSVKVWLDNLSQANLTDKTAKVNKEVAAALYYNMAVYSILIKDFKASADYFTKADQADSGFDNASAMAKMAENWKKDQEEYEKRMAEVSK